MGNLSNVSKLEFSNPTDFLKKQSDLRNYMGYKSQSSMEKEINYLEKLFAIDFKEKFFNEDSREYEIPLLTYELFKVFLHSEVKKVTTLENKKALEKNRPIDLVQSAMEAALLSSIDSMCENNSHYYLRFIQGNLQSSVFYKMNCKNDEFVLKDLNVWMRSVKKLYQRIENESKNYDKKDNRTKKKIDQEYKKITMNTSYQVGNYSFENLLYYELNDKVSRERGSDCKSNKEKQLQVFELFFSELSLSINLLDLLKMWGFRILLADRKYIDELENMKKDNRTSLFLWLKWLILSEIELFQQLRKENSMTIDRKEYIKSMLSIMPYYQVLIGLSNQHSFYYWSCIEKEKKYQEYYDKCFTLYELYEACKRNGLRLERSELSDRIDITTGIINKKGADIPFTRIEILEFCRKNNIFLPQIGDQQSYISIAKINGRNERRRVELQIQKLALYGKTGLNENHIIKQKRSEKDNRKEFQQSMLIQNFHKDFSLFLKKVKEFSIENKVENYREKLEKEYLDEKNSSDSEYLSKYKLQLFDCAMMDAQIAYENELEVKNKMEIASGLGNVSPSIVEEKIFGIFEKAQGKDYLVDVIFSFKTGQKHTF
ncbi:hypothetical protein [Enterococcus sp. BWR-S5]|uniref:hypothetical protein n=1 Tax=Enterococcus sp. BWR-S5 TaxID=2787714 RepID=UPI001920A5B5|nr:hypothetical protein [Enterococcus sp. BWR-S5]MBL1224207.1 hypothetical protein [Enterococcus sp. BWR-S5]